MIDLTKYIETAGPLRALGVIVEQDGKEVAKHLWEAPHRRNLYSATKSFTSAAVGLALKEGLLSLDEKLTDVFAEDLPDEVSPHLEKATVRDLLTMALGQEKPYLMGVDRPYYEDENWVRSTLAQPFVHDPGEVFMYSNSGPYLAGILVQRRCGTDLVHYMTPRLFKPIGISLPTWETDPLGNNFGAGGLFLTIEEFHTFGRLYANRGRCGDRQILTEEWVAASTGRQQDNDRFGYGYLIWRGQNDTFYISGKYGQTIVFFPDKNAFVTTTAESRQQPALLQAVYDHIYPQL